MDTVNENPIDRPKVPLVLTARGEGRERTIGALQQELGELYRRRASFSDAGSSAVQLTLEVRSIDAGIRETIKALETFGQLKRLPSFGARYEAMLPALVAREWVDDGVEATCFFCGAVRGIAWFPRGLAPEPDGWCVDRSGGKSPYGNSFNGSVATSSPFLMHAPDCIYQLTQHTREEHAGQPEEAVKHIAKRFPGIPLGADDDHPTHYEP
jgi:hypothetical protein